MSGKIDDKFISIYLYHLCMLSYQQQIGLHILISWGKKVCTELKNKTINWGLIIAHTGLELNMWSNM